MIFRRLLLLMLVCLAGRLSLAEETHWAYQTPRRTRLPVVQQQDWPRTAIDAYLLAKLEAAGLQPSPAAERPAWIRRVTYDLTGLPPTPEEVQAFLDDARPGAEERVVDRLLASPRFGERMAVDWLDLAHYADTHGYHTDSHRDMWRWRDWVIEAFNRNLPYDQFTIQQLAGDLLPQATREQRIATGFLRNHMINFEDGVIADEFRNEYVVDRVNQVATVWLGQTIACAQCHDHKYDPFTQREFYDLYAFFNNVPENGVDGRYGNAPPVLAAPTREQQKKEAALELRRAELTRLLQARALAARADQAAWEKAGAAAQAEPPGDMLAYLPLDNLAEGQTADRAAPDRTAKVQGEPYLLEGKFGDAFLLGGDVSIGLGELPLASDKPFSIAAWVHPTTTDAMAIVARREEKTGRGFEVGLREGHLFAGLWRTSPDNGLATATTAALPINQWSHVTAVYDGSGKASGWRLYLNGQLQPSKVELDALAGSTAGDGVLEVGRRGEEAGFRGLLDEVRLYARVLDATAAGILAGGDPIGELLAIPSDARTADQQAALQRYYLEQVDPVYSADARRLAEVVRGLEKIEREAPTVMVMQELAEPRKTFVLEGGNYRFPTDEASPGTPASLPPWRSDWPRNRLGLALWLTDPAHPLTARVAVNRYWRMMFGEGLVATAEDFGSRGERPSHPALLDHLAREFVDSGWDVKGLLRSLVLSAAYRQTAQAPAAAYAADPQNRLLARGPGHRLPVEMIRDGALFTSGLLVGEIGGRSVFPYQPPGLWREVSFNPRDYTAQVYQQGDGADLFRRSIYTFWKRSMPPPAMSAFGAPNRETCTVTRTRPNTVQTALVLLNDPTYVEAARCLAGRMLRETAQASPEKKHDQGPPPAPAEILESGFRRLLARPPTSAEADVLLQLYTAELSRYQEDPAAAQALLAVGESSADAPSTASEWAAWTVVANVLFNMRQATVK
ncbi:DUF1553 domain-containing protein [Lignipirellula cremea]|uniref:LamG-like jellyroll fold domain-containing protein n=1 Tax=Lignipirellula cremea TaxID=2528010 RepID=A0A518E1D9_9BACT|nr:DUF1553 domain-containing protein [Lignipirellula cremea]QDU97909.1 hypothetical protein Pla8534_57670 [Lignipirellula cremea]